MVADFLIDRLWCYDLHERPKTYRTTYEVRQESVLRTSSTGVLALDLPVGMASIGFADDVELYANKAGYEIKSWRTPSQKIRRRQHEDQSWGTNNTVKSCA